MSGDGYAIGAVARATGLTAHVLRLWEQRYGAIEAARTPSGQRRYSTEDLERLKRLKRLVDRGERISALAGLSDAELDERLAQLSEPPPARPLRRGTPRVAVIGATLPERFAAEGLEPALAASEPTRFVKDLQGLRVDAVIVEADILDTDVLRLLRRVRGVAGRAPIAVVYRFARDADVVAVGDAGVTAVRAPARAEQVLAALPARVAPAPSKPPEPLAAATTAPHFSAAQLARLATTESNVDCECPRHLADLVASLQAFERYSARCVDRNADDAALHDYLLETTAAARAHMETALIRLMEAESIDPDA